MSDGKYHARPVMAARCRTSDGIACVEILWQTVGESQGFKSFINLELPDGTPDRTSIAIARAWACEWSGNDPSWFANHLNELSRHDYLVTVRDGVVIPGGIVRMNSYDAARLAAQANRAASVPTPPTEQKPSKRPPVLPPEIVREIVTCIEEQGKVTGDSLWIAFRSATQALSPDEREDLWIAYRKYLGLDKKDQYDFLPEDWQLMYKEITK